MNYVKQAGHGQHACQSWISTDCCVQRKVIGLCFQCVAHTVLCGASLWCRASLWKQDVIPPAVCCKGEVLDHPSFWAKPQSFSLGPCCSRSFLSEIHYLYKAMSECSFCTTDDMIIWLYWCITGICVLLVGSVIAAVICMTKKRAGKTHTT